MNTPLRAGSQPGEASIIVAFKSPATPNVGHWVMAQWTRSTWIHAELLLRHPRQIGFSSNPEQGVMPKTWNEVVNSTDTWELYVVPVTSEADVFDFVCSQVGKPYNLKGVWLGHVVKKDRPQLNRWHCSELVYSVLSQYARLDIPPRDPVSVSPADLRTYLRQSGCQQFSINDLITQLP